MTFIHRHGDDYLIGFRDLIFTYYIRILYLLLCTRFWWESPKERDHLEDQGVGGKMGLEWILGRLAWGVWIGFDCLRTGTGGGLL
jgi:hypothetical protein